MQRIKIGTMGLLIMAGISFGQFSISGTGNSISGTTAGTSLVWQTNGTTWTQTGVSTNETRKDDGKGPTLIQVKSSAHKIPASGIATAAWLKLAKQVNLDSPAVDEAKLAGVINDHGWSVYDYAKVDDYLYRAALKQGTNVRWVWKPLRESDVKASSDNSWIVRSGMGYVYPKVYGKAVPERILEKVACVLADMSDAIFLVSDYEVVKPDPFLAVTTPKLLSQDRIFIVDQWDEPGFTEKGAPSHEDVAKSLKRANDKQLIAAVH